MREATRSQDVEEDKGNKQCKEDKRIRQITETLSYMKDEGRMDGSKEGRTEMD